MNTTRTPLTSAWRFKELASRGTSPASDLDWLPAQVPGHVHLDLVRNGVIEDPFYRMAERGCAWVDEADWVYETTFTVEEVPACAYLVFHGLDTIAEIYLNGEELGRTDNMFVPHEFPVGTAQTPPAPNSGEAASPAPGNGGASGNPQCAIRNPQSNARLQQGVNTLRVVFRSALRVGRERQRAWMEAGNDSLPHPAWNRWDERSFVRKAQYMYGWDWGPELVSCGIWRPVELVTVPVARLLGWKYDVEFTDDGKAVVRVEAEVGRAPGQEETELWFGPGLVLNNETGEALPEDELFGSVPQSVPTGAGVVRVSANLDGGRVYRWQPNGCGEPNTYTLLLSVYSGDETFDDESTTIGLRTVELVRDSDADGKGEGFKFRVNGRDVFAKGANWIPEDSFPSRLAAFQFSNMDPYEYVRARQWPETDMRQEQLIRAARDAGYNMLRVWGGGLYESEHFYNLCDRYGILVWQDFPYACGYYPDTGEYAEAARREAVAAVRRIRNHPSLALWCGNNENNSMFHDGWEGASNKAPRLLGEHLYHDVLPAVVQAEDPKTPYWPSSPYGGDNPNSQEFGDRHDWDVWHGVGDWVHYVEDDSRFLSEFGFAASCGLPAWDKCLAESDKWPWSPAVRWHDKTRKGYATYMGYVALHFPEPQTLEDLVYYSQLNQAEALKCGIEHWRRRKGRCWGTLFWQLNDCWPVQSWAVIDSELDPKAAYFASKRFYAPVLLSLVREGDTVHAHLTNDRLEDVQGDVTLTIESFDGDVLASATENVFVGANGTEQVASIGVEAVKAHARTVYVYARFEPYTELGQPVENYLFLAEPKDLRLAAPGLIATVEEDDAFVRVTLGAQRFAPYVWWRLEGRPAPFDADNFFHLRAGESRTVRLIKSTDVPSADAARGLLRLRSL